MKSLIYFSYNYIFICFKVFGSSKQKYLEVRYYFSIVILTLLTVEDLSYIFYTEIE